MFVGGSDLLFGSVITYMAHGHAGFSYREVSEDC